MFPSTSAESKNCPYQQKIKGIAEGIINNRWGGEEGEEGRGRGGGREGIQSNAIHIDGKPFQIVVFIFRRVGRSARGRGGGRGRERVSGGKNDRE
jgi:hypothetical protein